VKAGGPLAAVKSIPTQNTQDQVESEALYNVENDVVPLFYEQDSAGMGGENDDIHEKAVAGLQHQSHGDGICRPVLRSLCPAALASHCRPRRSHPLSGGLAKTRAHARSKGKILEVDSEQPKEAVVGSKLKVAARVSLGRSLTIRRSRPGLHRTLVYFTRARSSAAKVALAASRCALFRITQTPCCLMNWLGLNGRNESGIVRDPHQP
jgi:hypothetical protein